MAPSIGAVIRTSNIEAMLAYPYMESFPPMSLTTHNPKWMDTIFREKMVFAKSYKAQETTAFRPLEDLLLVIRYIHI